MPNTVSTSRELVPYRPKPVATVMSARIEFEKLSSKAVAELFRKTSQRLFMQETPVMSALRHRSPLMAQIIDNTLKKTFSKGASSRFHHFTNLMAANQEPNPSSLKGRILREIFRTAIDVARQGLEIKPGEKTEIDLLPDMPKPPCGT